VAPAPPARRPLGRANPASGRAAGFWRDAPAPSSEPTTSATPAPASAEPNRAAVPLQAVRVGDHATLLLAARRPLGDDDLRVIGLAAAPLIELLTLRGLIGPTAAAAEGKEKEKDG
jgi:hypothetical protein